MDHQHIHRRKLFSLVAGAVIVAPTLCAAEEEDITAAEDLMREHGVLKRVLLIYDEVRDRIARKTPFPPEAVSSSATIIHSFIEQYHEKLEEDHLFAQQARRPGKHPRLVRRVHPGRAAPAIDSGNAVSARRRFPHHHPRRLNARPRNSDLVMQKGIQDRVQLALRFLARPHTWQKYLEVRLLIRIRRCSGARTGRVVDDGQNFPRTIRAIRPSGVDRAAGVKGRIARTKRRAPDRPTPLVDQRCQPPIRVVGYGQLSQRPGSMRTGCEAHRPHFLIHIDERQPHGDRPIGVQRPVVTILMPRRAIAPRRLEKSLIVIEPNGRHAENGGCNSRKAS